MAGSIENREYGDINGRITSYHRHYLKEEQT